MEMTDQEFDLLDELYFIKTFNELAQALGWPADQLKETLAALIDRGWVKATALQDGDVPPQHPIDRAELGHLHYYYLATKAGLMAHNGR